MKHSIVSKFLMCLAFVSYAYADEQHAAFIKNIFIAEAEKILQQENGALDAEINRAPRPDAPVISHPTYPVGPLPGPQGPQGKPGPAASVPTCSPFKLLENATAGDVVRLVPDPTNQFGAKAAIRKIKKGPVFDWATRAGGSTGSDIGNDVAVDCQGNVYITGQFAGTVTFGNNLTLVSKESSPGVFTIDIFVAKINPTTGEWIWATRTGGTVGTDIGNSVATDCQGNVYVTGEFIGTVTFGNSITLKSASEDAGETDIFVAKLNSTTGEWVWATRAGGSVATFADRGNGIATDCSGNVYVTGELAGTVTFGSSITLFASPDAAINLFVAKVDPANGEWVWATRAYSTDARGFDIITDCQNNVLITGQFSATVTFGNTITLVSGGGTDILVAKLDPTTGSWVWATRVGSTGAVNDFGDGITTDCLGNIYVTGAFRGTVTFGDKITLVSGTATESDIFVAKLDGATTGSWVWAKRAGSIGGAFSDVGHAIATDCSGNVYVTGEFRGTVTFGNSITLVSQLAESTIDMFVTKLEPLTGEWVWATRIGSNSASSDIGLGIATDCQRNIYLTGQFRGTVTFGNSITLVSETAGSTIDLFVAKLIDDERTLKTLGILQESGAAGSTKAASFAGTVVSDVFTSLVPAADYYIDSTLTFTSCCCKCSCCCDANFKFMGTACSPTSFLLRDCC